MKKNSRVYLFVAVIFLGFFFVKNKFSLQDSRNSEFMILNWRMTPNFVEHIERPVIFTFHLKDKSNLPIENAEITIDLTMDKEVTPSLHAVAVPDKNGFYKSSIVLGKQGEWTLFLTVKKLNGELIKRELTFHTNKK